MQSRKRSEHKSMWKSIKVLDDDLVLNYQLDHTGRLCCPFDRKTYRNIKKLMITLKSNSDKKKKEENITIDIGKKPITESILGILDYPDDKFDFFDQLDGFFMSELNQL